MQDNIRIGIGYDIHRLKKGRKFILAGVQIPFEKGEDGHSDGDVLAHAVCDAILGGCALGDIGELFPPDDPVYKDADSMRFLQRVFNRVKKSGWKIINLDCIVICEEPKVMPFRTVICKALAQVLELDAECVFVKGKTAEGLGAIGKGKAIEAHAVCLLEKIQ